MSCGHNIHQCLYFNGCVTCDGADAPNNWAFVLDVCLYCALSNAEPAVTRLHLRFSDAKREAEDGDETRLAQTVVYLMGKQEALLDTLRRTKWRRCRHPWFSASFRRGYNQGVQDLACVDNLFLVIVDPSQSPKVMVKAFAGCSLFSLVLHVQKSFPSLTAAGTGPRTEQSRGSFLASVRRGDAPAWQLFYVSESRHVRLYQEISRLRVSHNTPP